MSTSASTSRSRGAPQLLGQTVVVVGGSAGIGLETARQARLEGASLILTGRNPERLQRAAIEIEAQSTAAFDATDAGALERFFRDLPNPIDHVMVTAGRPYYGLLLDMDFAQARAAIEEHLVLAIQVARNGAHKVRPGGTLLFMGGTGARRPGIGLGIASTLTAAFPSLIANLALEVAPVRVNLISAGFVDTPLSAELLGDDVARQHLESLDKVARILRLGVYVATSGDVRDQPKVADGASEVLQDVLGSNKNPSCLVYGVASLPLGCPVELEIIFEVAL